ncbi:MAG: transposase [Microcoleaceae cyanobacterium]
MIVLEMKAYPKQHQQVAIDEAILTVQFIRNKALRLWMDGGKEDKINKYDLNKYCAVLAKDFVFAGELNSTARQAAAERAWSAIARFYDNCKKSPQAARNPGGIGYPKFQKYNRSVEYKHSGWKLSEDRNKITFTDKKGIGTLKLKGTRDLNFYPVDQIKRVRIVRRADGYYVQFCLSVNIHDYTKPLTPAKKCIGLDVGLARFYTDSDGHTVEVPQYYRKAEKQLNRLNRRKSKKFKKGCTQSNNYKKARIRYALKHLRVSRQRKGFAVETALRVIQSSDLIAYVGASLPTLGGIDLKVSNMVRNQHLAKSINDAAWSTFREWLEYFGYKYKKVTVAVPPHNTSQNCSECGEKVKKSLSTRTHQCQCGCVLDRDHNAALNILSLGLSTVGHTGSKAWGENASALVGENLLTEAISVN